ncbi:MAG: DUF1501 domain-containing protein [Phaeodactylibacter sp.]|nr:DUF1501 domain-containing protein [Phaeodactylibacter sp.]
MKRRKFLQSTATAVGLPVVLNGMGVSAVRKSQLFNFLNTDNDKVLVLIQLSGGNDGLATVLPLDQYSNLAAARSNILIPESSALLLDDMTGLHPAMTGMKGLYDDAKLAILQAVGYPNQNRSHFRSTDIWTTASPAEEFWTTGWLGRHLDVDHPDFPTGYPNEDDPDPLAITMGTLVSQTCQGIAANYSLALEDPFNLSPLTQGGDDEVPDTYYGDELTFLRQTISQTNAYSEVITTAAENGNNLAAYPGDNRLAQQLKNVALLISGGLQTKIYVVTLGGFDTHANQTEDGAPLEGDHANLLRTLSDAVAAFQEDLKLLDLQERVVGMTFSEFGRRIRSNDSFGTDHGTAAPLMVFGSCVNPGILGTNPEIPDEVDVQLGVPMQYDFRNVYGSILMDWFELEQSVVQQLLFDDFAYIPIVNGCATTATTDLEPPATELGLQVYPNPLRRHATIEFNCAKERVRLSLFDSLGHEVKVLFDKTLTAGKHQVALDAKGLSSGTYFCRLQLTAGRQEVARVVVH